MSQLYWDVKPYKRKTKTFVHILTYKQNVFLKPPQRISLTENPKVIGQIDQLCFI